MDQPTNWPSILGLAVVTIAVISAATLPGKSLFRSGHGMSQPIWYSVPVTLGIFGALILLSVMGLLRAESSLTSWTYGLAVLGLAIYMARIVIWTVREARKLDQVGDQSE